MAWPKQGLFGIKGPGADRTTRHTLLFLILIANVGTLIFAFDRIMEKGDRGFSVVPPDLPFYGLLALSVVLSVISLFLPSYAEAETRFGARAVVSGLPIGAVIILLNAVL